MVDRPSLCGGRRGGRRRADLRGGRRRAALSLRSGTGPGGPGSAGGGVIRCWLGLLRARSGPGGPRLAGNGTTVSSAWFWPGEAAKVAPWPWWRALVAGASGGGVVPAWGGSVQGFQATVRRWRRLTRAGRPDPGQAGLELAVLYGPCGARAMLSPVRPSCPSSCGCHALPPPFVELTRLLGHESSGGGGCGVREKSLSARPALTR